MNENRKNHHCTCVKIGTTGLMIEGLSGSGKSSLALGLLDLASRKGIAHGLICDDQAFVEVIDDQLWAFAPQSIEGKIEVHGFGIADMKFLQKGKIDLVCNLVEQNLVPRMAEEKTCDRYGVKLAYIELPRQHEAQCVRILQLKMGVAL